MRRLRGAVRPMPGMSSRIRQSRYAESFPVPADRIDEILRGLGDQLTGIYQAEVDAVAAAARAIR